MVFLDTTTVYVEDRRGIFISTTVSFNNRRGILISTTVSFINRRGRFQQKRNKISVRSFESQIIIPVHSFMT